MPISMIVQGESTQAAEQKVSLVAVAAGQRLAEEALAGGLHRF